MMPANLENSAVATGWKRSILIQFQIKAMPKNVQIMMQLHSFHMLARLCSEEGLQNGACWTSVLVVEPIIESYPNSWLPFIPL